MTVTGADPPSTLSADRPMTHDFRERGDAGRHTRMAVGVAALPYDVAVEVEAVFEVG